MSFGASLMAAIERDQYVGGYMHAAAGHSQDMTRHCFGSEAAWVAWTAGFAAGESVEHPAEHLHPWCAETVAHAAASYLAWVAAAHLEPAS